MANTLLLRFGGPAISANPSTPQPLQEFTPLMSYLRFLIVGLILLAGTAAFAQPNAANRNDRPSTATLARPNAAPSPLAVGTQAPDFRVKDEKGNTVALQDFRGKKNVVLVFYPGNDTPGCTRQLCSIRDQWADFKDKNVAVYGVNHADAASHQRFSTKFSFPFPLIVDEGGRIARQYGTWNPSGFTSRTVYGIDKNGKIVFAEKGMPENDQILAAFERTTGAGI